MMMQPDNQVVAKQPTTKLKRTGGTKSKTGCLTCRIRHVKCDEEKPECHQCRKTGRKCDGYNQQVPKKSKSPVSIVGTSQAPPPPVRVDSSKPDRRIVLFPGTREERECVDFFCNQTSRALPALFDSDIWLHMVPQLSQTVPVIRHAVAAVSARHRKLLRLDPSLDPYAAEMDEKFALQQYNKAIAHMKEYISLPNQPIELTLTACMLFACLDTLHGHHTQALNHIEAGVRILNELKSKNQSDRLPKNIPPELSHLWLRLNIQLSLHGRSMISFNFENMSEENSSWSSISQARYSLDKLMTKALVFVRKAGIERTIERTWLVPEQRSICSEFDAWWKSLKKLMKSRKVVKATDPRAPLLLCIQYHVSLVWLENCLSRDESLYDNFNVSFDAIARDAEQLLAINSNQETDRGLNHVSLEAGIIPMLFWSATRCRHPVIRRKLIQLLYACPDREGLWNSIEYVKVAELVMEVEEAEVSLLPVEQRIPADRNRVYEALIPDENKAAPGEVILYMKPYGMDSDWHIERRYVTF